MTADTLNQHLTGGGTVLIGTYARCTRYARRHAGMFVQRPDGLYVQHGRSYDYLGPADRPYVAIRLA